MAGPSATKTITPTAALWDRFWCKVDKTDTCWLWTATVNNKGYGMISDLLAHRVSYTFFRGPIPEGLSLDHLCRNPRCVNPHHLEAVTHAENMRRGSVSRGGRNKKRQ